MTDIKEVSKEKEFTIIDYVNLFLVNRKKIIIVTLSAAILSALTAFFIIKPVFLSTGVVKTATTKSSMLGGLLSSTGLSDLGDFGDLAPGSGSSASELALYENILYSRKCLEETIIKFNIMEEEDFKYMYDALKYFRENIMVINKDKIAGTLSVGVYDTDPVRSKEISDFLIYQLNKINIEMNVQNARNNRTFIEERYKLVQNDLKKAEDSLQMFQDKFGIAPDIQIQAATKGSLELEAEVKSEEVKLELLKKLLSPDQSEVRMQEDKIAAMKKQLEETVNSDFSENRLNLKGSPAIILNYYRLRRDVEIQNKILVTLIPLLEQSKIEENRETPTVLILDNPNVPDKKSKPKRLYIIIFSTLLVFIFSYLYYYLKDFYFRKFKFND
jgi:capsule polysaccharide export protein KpsE/RkpR